jgi:hypothetical protein
VSLIEQTTPYELLFRIKPDGYVISHARFRTQIIKDGVVLSDHPGPALTLEQAAAAGFPLDTLLSEVHLATAKALDAERVESAMKIAALEARLTEALASKEK